MNERLTSTEVVGALIHDRSPNSGWVRDVRGPVTPPEIWLADAGLWIRSDGSYVTGWREGVHLGQRFGWLARLRIRQAVRWWAKRQVTTP